MSLDTSMRVTARAQGPMHLVTGVWPILHLPSFLAVTGPKSDLWLVQTFGALLGGLGGVLIFASLRPQVDRSAAHVGWVTAAVLAAADIIFVLSGAIAPI